MAVRNHLRKDLSTNGVIVPGEWTSLTPVTSSQINKEEGNGIYRPSFPKDT